PHLAPAHPATRAGAGARTPAGPHGPRERPGLEHAAIGRGERRTDRLVAAADRGVLEARAIALDMRTGVGALDGPGEVRAVRVRDVRPGSAPAERALSWSGPG
ncbi:MAG: hypothetical protein ACK462_14475, partial [Planctomyces sp.]